MSTQQQPSLHPMRLSFHQWRTIAQQSPKTCFRRKQTASTPKTRFFPHRSSTQKTIEETRKSHLRKTIQQIGLNFNQKNNEHHFL
jgi:hypothetical protein